MALYIPTAVASDYFHRDPPSQLIGLSGLYGLGSWAGAGGCACPVISIAHDKRNGKRFPRAPRASGVASASESVLFIENCGIRQSKGPPSPWRFWWRPGPACIRAPAGAGARSPPRVPSKLELPWNAKLECGGYHQLNLVYYCSGSHDDHGHVETRAS